MVKSKTRRKANIFVWLFCVFCPFIFLFSFQESGEHSSRLNNMFRKGKAEFFRQLKLEFGVHPWKFRLLPDNIQRIENAESEIPYLYENLVNIMYLKESPVFDALIKNGSEDSLKKWDERFIRLSQQTAACFIRSLFVEESTFSPGEGKNNRPSRNLLDLVLSSFQERNSSQRYPRFRFTPDIFSIGTDPLWGFRVARFKGVHKATKGKGVKIGVISSGFGQGAEPINRHPVNLEASFSLIGRKQPPWAGERISIDDEDGRGTVAASILAAASPESEIAVYKVIDNPKSVYTFWPAMQTAHAVYKAVHDGVDVILVTSVFGNDYDFLRDACQYAYEHSVIIVCPNGGLWDVSPDKPHQFPAHYNTTIAVAGVVPDNRNEPVPWKDSGASHFATIAAPAYIGDLKVQKDFEPEISIQNNSWAAAFTCGLVALLSSKIPKTEEELSGQYFQRINEIVTQSADPRILGFKNFNPKVGYGMIDTEKSVGEGLQTYLEKMKTIEDNFKKRMVELEIKEQDAKNKE